MKLNLHIKYYNNIQIFKEFEILLWKKRKKEKNTFDTFFLNTIKVRN